MLICNILVSTGVEKISCIGLLLPYYECLKSYTTNNIL